MKRIIALFISMAIFITGITCLPENAKVTNQAEAKVTGTTGTAEMTDIFCVCGNKKTYKVSASYPDSGMKKTCSYSADYSDAYFNKSAKKVQLKLAKMSVLASAAAYKSDQAVKLLEDCGFSAKYVSKGVTEKDNDHVAYAIGLKKINKVNVVAVWIKGTSGDYEWVSNFNLGTGKTHKGFAKAEKEMRKSITKYLKENKISGKTKFWITGHSRGAAVANIYAKKMTDKYGSANIYAYTFASPRVTRLANKKKYNNIRNYINPGDFVTEVAPKKWNYHRYGKDYVLKDRSKMEKHFKKITGKEYEGYTKAEKNDLLNAFLVYCGKSVKDYYKVKKKTNTTPADFCMKGLAMALNTDFAVKMSGLKYTSDIAAKDEDANLVYNKFIVEGATNNKFRHAHSLTGYICWLDCMN